MDTTEERQPLVLDTVSITNEITVMLDQLKDAKEHLAGLSEEMQAYLDEAMKAPIYQALNEAYFEAKATAVILEDAIKTDGMKLYLNDSPLPKRTGIRNYKKVSIIDEQEAKEWALKNFTPSLKLDPKVFGDAAKRGNVPMHLVVITTEPQVTISEKL